MWRHWHVGYDPNNRFRNTQAFYSLPSVDEWYKAAYYDPDASIYYAYPTGSDSVPDGIDFVADTAFDAVFIDRAFDTQPNDITNVGVLSPYGTAGQGGNVSEWQESQIRLLNNQNPVSYGVRGGAWSFYSNSLLTTSIAGLFPTDQNVNIGFRIASVSIPEPSTIWLLCLGGVLLIPGLFR